MASPPHRSQPPYPPLNNPKKRPPLPLNPQAPASKRRKHPSISNVSTPGTSHPLRQTSFPPEEAAIDDARSVSVESDATGVTGGRSVVTAGTGAKGRKRGRKKKEEASVKSGARGAAGSVGGQGEEEEEEEKEEDGDVDDGLEDDGEKVDKEAEAKNLSVLVDAFNRDQSDRYDMFRRVKLKKEIVRKITNQTLSQSVPPSVITVVSGSTKVFIGSLVERAREIQLQQASPSSSPSPPPSHASLHSQSPHFSPDLPASSSTLVNMENDDDDIFASGTSTGNLSFEKPRAKKGKDLGPLLPEHLREAFRRYKRAGEGGGAGVGGVSVGLGVKGIAAVRFASGGKRLFR